MRLENKRIKLRKMRLEDVAHYNRWSNDFEVIENTYPNLDSASLADTQKFFVKISNDRHSKTYIIECKATNTPIGITSLIGYDPYNHNSEFIIDIGEKSYWGKGFGREATETLLAYAFEELNLHRIALRVFSFNERAISLYRTIGFKEEGRAREALFRYGQWHDIVSMGILQQEYFANK